MDLEAPPAQGQVGGPVPLAETLTATVLQLARLIAIRVTHLPVEEQMRQLVIVNPRGNGQQRVLEPRIRNQERHTARRIDEFGLADGQVQAAREDIPRSSLSQIDRAPMRQAGIQLEVVGDVIIGIGSRTRGVLGISCLKHGDGLADHRNRDASTGAGIGVDGV